MFFSVQTGIEGLLVPLGNPKSTRVPEIKQIKKITLCLL